jgi:hypothetical protein
MLQFTQGFLPASFSDTWVTNAIRRLDQLLKLLKTFSTLFTEVTRGRDIFLDKQ